MTEQPTSQTPTTNALEAAEENGTQDITPTPKAQTSYDKKVSSKTLDAEPKDTQAQ